MGPIPFFPFDEKPLLVIGCLALIGAAAIIGAVVWGIYWLTQHVQFV